MSSPALQTFFPEAKTADKPPAPRSSGKPSGIGASSRDAFDVRLARMSPRQRIEASRNGGFTRHERAVWASRHPDEVPTVNGEFEWLVLGSADLN
jgi:hypothetical protein